MIGPIVIRSQGDPDSRERARDRILSRLCAAAAHSRHAGRNSAVFGFDAFARVQGWLGIDGSIHRTAIPLNSFPIFKGVGSLIPGLRRALQLLQKPARGIRQGLQNSILSAGSAGLAGVLVGHQQTRRKLGNVRHSTGEIRHEQR